MKKNKSLKLGLALGSGGAKGAALIGALKALQEENLNFDVVAGTSIGSVIGALYAKGYSADDLWNLKSELRLGDPSAMLAFAFGGFSLKGSLDKILGGAYFSDLNKPFVAVATDLATGEEVDMDGGELSSALAASCAIQPIFGAVTRNGKRLVDGAFVNSVPADVVKRLGADVVVSINLSKGVDTNEHIKRALDASYPENGVKIAVRSKACYEFSDVVIEPDLTGFTSASLDGFDEMYDRGYAAAKNTINDIKRVLD